MDSTNDDTFPGLDSSAEAITLRLKGIKVADICAIVGLFEENRREVERNLDRCGSTSLTDENMNNAKVRGKQR